MSILGKGGMGTVYKAQHLIFNEISALKVASSQLDEISAQRFQREAVVSKLLEHENIVKVTDFGLVDFIVPFFVMEYVEGPSLSALIREKGRLKVEEAIELFLQVCNGMTNAHDKGVIHRDLKPSNIIVTSKNGASCAKVLDFGIAKLLEHEEGQGLTRTGDVFGSPLYMSPEQCTASKVDHRADIYSFGCSFFEAICGVPPFNGETALHTMMQHQTAPVPTLKEASLGLVVEPALENMMAKLLAKNPEDRYQSFDEVKVDLNLVRTGKQPLIAVKEKEIDRVERRARREMLPWIVAIASLGITVAAVSIWFSTRPTNEVQKQEVAAEPEWFDHEKMTDVKPFATTFIGKDGKEWKRFSFPKGKYFGVLETLPDKLNRYQSFQANGTVEIPVSLPLVLVLRADSIRDSKLLRGFGKNDLYGISARKLFSDIDDKFLHDVFPLSGLKALILDATEVTDTGMHLINEHLLNLEELSVGSTEITGDTISKYPNLRNLDRLRMGGNKRGGLVLSKLKDSTKLRYLSICVCELKNTDLQSINTLTNLGTLMLRNNKEVSDDGIAHLVGLKKLQMLDVSGCSISPAAIDSLKQITSLKNVSISVKGWSDSEVARLRNSLPKGCELVIANSARTNSSEVEF